MSAGPFAPLTTLRFLRNQRGWTLDHLADLIGTHGSTVKKWEAGFRYPSTEMIGRLAEVLECTENDITAIDHCDH